MVSSFHETQSKRKNKRGLPDHLWVLQRAPEGRSGRTERSKGAQGRIMHQRPENRGALNQPTRGSHVELWTLNLAFSSSGHHAVVGGGQRAARRRLWCTSGGGGARRTAVGVRPSGRGARS